MLQTKSREATMRSAIGEEESKGAENSAEAS